MTIKNCINSQKIVLFMGSTHTYYILSISVQYFELKSSNSNLLLCIANVAVIILLNCSVFVHCRDYGTTMEVLKTDVCCGVLVIY